MIQNRFIVIVPVYNAEKYIKKCIDSILNQTYKNFMLTIIDDLSTDSTRGIIRDIVNTQIHDNDEYNFQYLELSEHTGSPIQNFKTAIELSNVEKEDIIITVDGDDWLYDENVLEYLNNIYQDNDIWFTYGQYEPASKTYKNLCREITDVKNYRKSNKWCTSHLRTIKKKLWDKIPKELLKDEHGKYYKYAGDTAYIYPSLELAGKKHIKFIDKVLYVYNDLNPLNEMKIAKEEQLRIAERIKSQPVLEELETC